MDTKQHVSITELLSISCLLVNEAMKHINEIRKQPIQSKWKGKDDPLTIADIHSQTILIKGKGSGRGGGREVAERDGERKREGGSGAGWGEGEGGSG